MKSFSIVIIVVSGLGLIFGSIIALARDLPRKSCREGYNIEPSVIVV